MNIINKSIFALLARSPLSGIIIKPANQIRFFARNRPQKPAASVHKFRSSSAEQRSHQQILVEGPQTVIFALRSRFGYKLSRFLIVLLLPISLYNLYATQRAEERLQATGKPSAEPSERAARVLSYGLVVFACFVIAGHAFFNSRLITRITLLPGRQLQIATMGALKQTQFVTPMDSVLPPLALSGNSAASFHWLHIVFNKQGPATGSFTRRYMLDVADNSVKGSAREVFMNLMKYNRPKGRMP